MLGDQGSPYVGRFARGWHRLPGWIPGQPQTRTGARLSIGTAFLTARTTRSGGPVGERAARGEEVDIAPSRFHERCGAGRSRGAGGEHVVDQEESGRCGPVRDASERIGHRPHAFLPGPARLRSGRLRPADEGGRGEIELACERPREHASLVEAALGPPPGRERDPGHRVGRRRAERRQGRCERLPHASPTGELQSVDRGPGGSLVREGGSRRRDGRRGTVPASIHVHRRRPPTVTAPRWLQREEFPGARGAERPRACAASGAGPREENIDRAIEHGGTLRRAADTVQDNGTSIGSPAPLTAIVSTCWIFSSGYAVTEPDPVSASKLVSSTGTRAPSAASVIVVSAPS
jgi:hypothetical protein